MTDIDTVYFIGYIFQLLNKVVCCSEIIFQCLQGLQGNFIAVWDTHFTDICQVLGTFYSRYLKNAWNFSKDLLLFVGVTQWS